KKSNNYNFALSNPNFECWLLYHFQDVFERSDIDADLKKHLPNYDKASIDVAKFLPKINDAINRAKNRDKPPCQDWPREHGKTTVYKLVERIISDSAASVPSP
ncbi:MAG: RloB family protein, partial [Alphaproteobacteria bacterium]|nr:RloB family protein [Alphaproteobacteria bacterium]